MFQKEMCCLCGVHKNDRERALCLVSSKILSPLLRLFAKPTAYSSFGTKNFDEFYLPLLLFGKFASQANESSPVKPYVQSTVSTDGLLGIHISLHLKGTTLRFSGTVVNKRIFFLYICVYIYIYIFNIEMF